MAKFILDIPDDIASRIFDAFAEEYSFGLNEILPMQKTKEDFFREKLMNYIFSVIESSEVKVAVESTRAEEIEKIGREIMVTVEKDIRK